MYKRLYYFLFNQITDAVKMLGEGYERDALQILVDAQKKAEQMFVEGTETDS